MVAFVVFFLLQSIWTDATSTRGGSDTGTAGDFDFYVFAQSWPAEYCYSSSSGAKSSRNSGSSNRNSGSSSRNSGSSSQRRLSSMAGCRQPTDYMRTSLGIHGLWPNYAQSRNGHAYPQDCQSDYGTNVNQTALGHVIEDMRSYWPDESASGWPDYTSSSWYGHEWSTHGTCSGLDQETYWSDTIHRVHLNIPTPEIIANNTGHMVSLADIQSAYNNGEPCQARQPCMVAVSCDSGNYLSAIISCWTRSYEQIACPTSVLSGSATCSSSRNVIIAAFPS